MVPKYFALFGYSKTEQLGMLMLLRLLGRNRQWGDVVRNKMDLVKYQRT